MISLTCLFEASFYFSLRVPLQADVIDNGDMLLFFYLFGLYVLFLKT
jgi:hypothetical protein